MDTASDNLRSKSKHISTSSLSAEMILYICQIGASSRNIYIYILYKHLISAEFGILLIYKTELYNVCIPIGNISI